METQLEIYYPTFTILFLPVSSFYRMDFLYYMFQIMLIILVQLTSLPRLFTILHHKGLSCTASAASTRLMPNPARSNSVLIHVVLGAPVGHLIFMISSNTTLTGVCSSSLNTCPSHLVLLVSMTLHLGVSSVMLCTSFSIVIFSQEKFSLYVNSWQCVLLAVLSRVLWYLRIRHYSWYWQTPWAKKVRIFISV